MSPQRLDIAAPDGTPIEVSRNHGKPTAAQEASLKLAQEKLRQLGSARPAPARTTRGQARAARAAAADGPTEPSVAAPSPPAASASDTPTPKAANPARVAKAKAAPATPATTPAEPRAQPASQAEGAPSPEATAPAPAPAAPAKPARKPMQVRFTGMKPMHVVEAALFSAGKPVSVEEIAETTGLPPESVRSGIKELVAAYEGRDSVLEVGKAGAKWGMQVKQQAAEPAAKFAPMEIPPKVLKTLALIAYHQPMKQSELVEMMGTKVYDHVPELVQRGLVRAREEGATKVLVTTAAFPEYFGLDAEKPEEVRAVMAKLVGLEAKPKEVAPTVTYEDPQPQAASPAPDPSPAANE